MTAARRYLPSYTVDDYRQWLGDWELWQGIPVAMSPSPFGPHQKVARDLVLELVRGVRDSGCDAEVLYEIDWVIDRHTVLRPDVLVTCGPLPAGHVQSTPTLVAEVVSAATADRDRTHKRALYDEQGVDVYLLADPDARSVELYRRESGGAWVREKVARDVVLRICDDCEFVFSQRALFA